MPEVGNCVIGERKKCTIVDSPVPARLEGRLSTDRGIRRRNTVPVHCDLRLNISRVIEFVDLEVIGTPVWPMEENRLP
jgi:hypothetical protein